MKICKVCGAQNEDDAVFCDECGRKIENASSAPAFGHVDERDAFSAPSTEETQNRSAAGALPFAEDAGIPDEEQEFEEFVASGFPGANDSEQAQASGLTAGRKPTFDVSGVFGRKNQQPKEEPEPDMTDIFPDESDVWLEESDADPFVQDIDGKTKVCHVNPAEEVTSFYPESQEVESVISGEFDEEDEWAGSNPYIEDAFGADEPVPSKDLSAKPPKRAAGSASKKKPAAKQDGDKNKRSAIIAVCVCAALCVVIAGVYIAYEKGLLPFGGLSETTTAPVGYTVPGSSTTTTAMPSYDGGSSYTNPTTQTYVYETTTVPQPEDTVPQDLSAYAGSLRKEDRYYQIRLQEDDWFINCRSTPEVQSGTQTNIIGKLQSGTTVYAEYTYGDRWIVCKYDGGYYFLSIYAANNPSQRRLVFPAD